MERKKGSFPIILLVIALAVIITTIILIASKSKHKDVSVEGGVYGGEISAEAFSGDELPYLKTISVKRGCSTEKAKLDKLEVIYRN